MRTLMLTVIVAGLSPILARAQEVRGSWADVQHLDPGRKIEIRATVNGKDSSLRATFVSASEDGLVFRQRNTESSLQLQNIRRVGVLNNSKRKRNMIIGAVAGSVPLLILGSQVDRYAHNESVYEGAAGATAGAAIGAGLGLLATFHSGYQAIYEAKH